MTDQDKREILEAMASQKAEILGAIAGVETRLGARIDKVEGRLGGVEVRLEKVERVVVALAQQTLNEDELRALGLVDHAPGTPFIAAPVRKHS